MASRKFESGATRGDSGGKIDPEAALSPLVLTAYCEYVRQHRLQEDGKLRSDENWQLGIPIASYMKSLLRHVLEAWRAYRQKEDMNDALFAIMFNTMGLLHERLKKELSPFGKLYTEKEISEYYYKGYKDGIISTSTRLIPPATSTTAATIPENQDCFFSRRDRRL